MSPLRSAVAFGEPSAERRAPIITLLEGGEELGSALSSAAIRARRRLSSLLRLVNWAFRL